MRSPGASNHDGGGGFPGYLEGGQLLGSFHTYWIAAPLSVPLLKGFRLHGPGW
ncbi:MAG: hypothetical protein LJF30_01210 [Acidobacteria bacterium]|nr:hypothetical protein [Acidobacteriota bacterium]